MERTDARIRFTKPIVRDETALPEALGYVCDPAQVEKRKKDVLWVDEHLGYKLKEKQLTEEESLIIGETLRKAKEVLQELQTSDIDFRLPSADRIYIYEMVDSKDESAIFAGGSCDCFGQFILIKISRGLNIDDPEALGVIAHEYGHYVLPVVVAKSNRKKDPYQAISSGLCWKDRWFREGVFKKYEPKPVIFLNHTVFSEPLADMFSLLCNNEEGFVRKTPYDSSDAFVFSFLAEYADRAGLEPREVFLRLLKANLERDFSIEQELVQVFGTEVMREINTLEYGGALGPAYPNRFGEIAEKGKFKDRFEQFLADIKGEGLRLPCSKAILKAIRSEA